MGKVSLLSSVIQFSEWLKVGNLLCWWRGQGFGHGNTGNLISQFNNQIKSSQEMFICLFANVPGELIFGSMLEASGGSCSSYNTGSASAWRRSFPRLLKPSSGCFTSSFSSYIQTWLQPGSRAPSIPREQPCCIHHQRRFSLFIRSIGLAWSHEQKPTKVCKMSPSHPDLLSPPSVWSRQSFKITFKFTWTSFSMLSLSLPGNQLNLRVGQRKTPGCGAAQLTQKLVPASETTNKVFLNLLQCTSLCEKEINIKWIALLQYSCLNGVVSQFTQRKISNKNISNRVLKELT